MPDWKTRLAVRYIADGAERLISPIDSFTPTFSLNREVLHSLEQTHIGMIYSPASITFSLTVKTLGTVAAELAMLAMNGGRFDIVLAEEGDDGTWSFSEIKLSQCVFTSATPTSATISGAPTATFSGVCLGAKATDNAGEATEIGTFAPAAGG